MHIVQILELLIIVLNRGIDIFRKLSNQDRMETGKKKEKQI